MTTTLRPVAGSAATGAAYDIVPVGPADRAALIELIRRSSVETRSARFHHAVAEFPHQHLADLTCTGCPHLALAARLTAPDSGGDIIGLTSASVVSGDHAEIAVWFRDDWQRHHVATTLLSTLLQWLSDAGFRRATAVVAIANTAARALGQKLAADAPVHRIDQTTIELDVPLPRPHPLCSPTATARAGSGRRLVGLLAGLLLVLAGCATTPRGGPPPQLHIDELTPLIITPLGADPIPVEGTDGRYHVAYELAVLNAAPRTATLTAVDTVTAEPDQRVLDHVSGDDLVARTILVGIADRKPEPVRSVPAGATALLLLDDTYRTAADIPPAMAHRVIADFEPAREDQVPLAKVYPDHATQTGGLVHPARRPPIVISPPVQGSNWVALNACCTISHHRGSMLPVGGRINASERYAVDWVRFDLSAHPLIDLDRGQIATTTGDPTRNDNYLAYNQPVLAVADATVVAVTTDMPDRSPRTVADGLRLDQYGGNHIILDLGNHTYAFYAHMQPHSATVRAGQRVTAGQELGRIGNSGNSSEPHLHFQLMNSPQPFTGDNLPYVIHDARYLGSVTPTGLADTAAAGHRTDELPLALSAASYQTPIQP
jgi:GNAT superfamily N-acetyltransferase